MAKLIDDMLERREAAGITQAELAHLAGVSEKTIRNIEKGRGGNLLTIKAINSALNRRRVK
jgi:DNA-binding XRE family transcriptional regulator